MINPISSINVSPRLSIQGLDQIATSDQADAFKNLLIDSLRQLDAASPNAGHAISPAADGGKPTAAHVLATIEQTDAALGVMMQIQDRLLGAYHEIQNIRV